MRHGRLLLTRLKPTEIIRITFTDPFGVWRAISFYAGRISLYAGQISFNAGQISLYAGQISFNAGTHAVGWALK